MIIIRSPAIPEFGFYIINFFQLFYDYDSLQPLFIIILLGIIQIFLFIRGHQLGNQFW